MIKGFIRYTMKLEKKIQVKGDSPVSWSSTDLKKTPKPEESETVHHVFFCFKAAQVIDFNGAAPMSSVS